MTGSRKRPATEEDGMLDEHEHTPRPAKRPSHQDLRRVPVAVQVGAGETADIFHCYAALLHLTSLHFRNELSTLDFKLEETTSKLDNLRLLTLPDEKAADFALYHEFLDKERLWSTRAELDNLTPFKLASLFYFSQRIGCQSLKCVVIGTLHAKTSRIALRIASRIKESIDFSPYSRAARWVAQNSATRPKSGIYLYLVHFFAYFMLQTVPRLEQKVLIDLPASFLWEVLLAINTALERHLPGLPTTPLPDTTDADSTANETINIDGDDSPEGEPAQAAIHVSSETRSAIDNLPKSHLVQTILIQSATLKIYKNILLGKTKETMVKQKTRRRTETEDEGMTSDDNERAPDKTFIGVESLCLYHDHATAQEKKACARKFPMKDRQGVWGLIPVMKAQ